MVGITGVNVLLFHKTDKHVPSFPLLAKPWSVPEFPVK